MNEVITFLKQAAAALRHPDAFVLGAMAMMWILGFTCGVLAQEIHSIKHQIMMHRYHGKRRGL